MWKFDLIKSWLEKHCNKNLWNWNPQHRRPLHYIMDHDLIIPHVKYGKIEEMLKTTRLFYKHKSNVFKLFIHLFYIVHVWEDLGNKVLRCSHWILGRTKISHVHRDSSCLQQEDVVSVSHSPCYSVDPCLRHIGLRSIWNPDLISWRGMEETQDGKVR